MPSSPLSKITPVSSSSSQTCNGNIASSPSAAFPSIPGAMVHDLSATTTAEHSETTNPQTARSIRGTVPSSFPPSFLQIFSCPCCLDLLSGPIILPCSHTFCGECLVRLSNINEGKVVCPLCRSVCLRRAELRRNLVVHEAVNEMMRVERRNGGNGAASGPYSNFGSNDRIERRIKFRDDEILRTMNERNGNYQESDEHVIDLGDRDTDDESDEERREQRYRRYNANQYHRDEEGFGEIGSDNHGLLVYREEDDPDYQPMVDVEAEDEDMEVPRELESSNPPSQNRTRRIHRRRRPVITIDSDED